MRAFAVTTNTKYGKNVFLTKANNGKEALNNLITKSSDYNDILGKRESNSMIIEIEVL